CLVAPGAIWGRSSGFGRRAGSAVSHQEIHRQAGVRSEYQDDSGIELHSLQARGESKNRRAHNFVAGRSIIGIAAKIQGLIPGGGSRGIASDPQYGHLGWKHLSGCLVLVSAGWILLLEIRWQVLRPGRRR